MRRTELEHVIRAASRIAEDSDIVIVGSQAILGQFSDAPATMLVSLEADVYPLHDPARAELIDGAMGDGSPFHMAFGYYAHGVGPETPKAPTGWQDRLVPLSTEGTGGATGWCLEAHDLVLAKCAAGREHDWAFAREALQHELVSIGELLRRADDLPLTSEHRRAVVRGLKAAAAARQKPSG